MVRTFMLWLPSWLTGLPDASTASAPRMRGFGVTGSFPLTLRLNNRGSIFGIERSKTLDQFRFSTCPFQGVRHIAKSPLTGVSFADSNLTLFNFH